MNKNILKNQEPQMLSNFVTNTELLMSRMKILTSILFTFLFLTAFSQDKVPNTFRLPIDGKVRFSGNYGELRPNHFHAGLDFRTGPNHVPLYAVESGYVSRIKVGTGGYGKVLYVTHANGYVSVYAHQHHFADKIAAFTYAEQKKNETFEIEIFPKPGELPAQKGEVIGYSGNTGSSGGPHLHFEIREEKTEVPLNPLTFYDHEDNVAPVVERMAVYGVPANGVPQIVSSRAVKQQKNKDGIYEISDLVHIPKNAGFAFSCFDREHSDGGKNQVYKIQIDVDGQKIYEHKMDHIGFDQSRYINWFQDISASLKAEKLQRCFVSGNNELPIFYDLKNNGVVTINDSKTHKAIVTFSDVKGNKSKLAFSFVCDLPLIESASSANCTFTCKEAHDVDISGSVFHFPEKTLFYDVEPNVRVYKNTVPNFFSPLYMVFSHDLPLLKAYDVKVKVNTPIDKRLQEKLCLVTMKEDLSGGSFCGGRYEDGFVTGSLKSGGIIGVKMDTIAPTISFASKKQVPMRSLQFIVGDNFSGIGHFRMEINGEWVLAEYEHKTRTIFYDFGPGSPKGELKVVLKVYDKCFNLSTSTVTVKR